MRKLFLPFVFVITLLSSCSQEAQDTRKVSGTWSINMYTDRWVYTGDCGVPFGYFNTFTATDIGTIDFTKDDPNWSSTDEDAHAGTRTVSYTYKDPQTGFEYPVQESLKFDWYFLDEKLIIHNPDEFVFEVYSMEDFDKDNWEMSFAGGDESSLGCTYNEQFYTLEKE